MKRTQRQPYARDSIRPAPELLAVQHLMPIAADDRARLKASIRSTQKVDPLPGYMGDDGFFYYLGGHNRYEITGELIAEEPARFQRAFAVLETELADTEPSRRSDFAISDNLNRRHLSAEQKRNLADHLLRQHPSLSDRAIASRIGIDHKTVGSRRLALAAHGEIPQVSSKAGRDGKQYRSKAPQKPAARRPKAPRITLTEWLSAGDQWVRHLQNGAPAREKTSAKKKIANWHKSLG